VADDHVPEAMLGRWRHVLGAARLGAPLHHKGTLRAVTAEDRTRYVLKAIIKDIGDVPRTERLFSEARVLRHLYAAGVPVAVPRPTDDGRPFAKHVSPHALRHTFALRSLRRGGNVVAVSKLLGTRRSRPHNGMSTTWPSGSCAQRCRISPCTLYMMVYTASCSR